MARPVASRPAQRQTPRDWVAFRTETGSIYEVWREAGDMGWRRRSTTLASGVLRSEEGRLRLWPRVRIGERCLMVGEPFNPPFDRLVVTSTVVAILEESDGLEARPRRELDALSPWPSFRHVRPGDRVTRLLGGAPMELVVSAVDEEFIRCGPPDTGWKFDRDTGMEVDEVIGWGPQFGVSGSYLIASEDGTSREEPEGPSKADRTRHIPEEGPS
jgi:hypothetical protein